MRRDPRKDVRRGPITNHPQRIDPRHFSTVVQTLYDELILEVIQTLNGTPEDVAMVVECLSATVLANCERVENKPVDKLVANFAANVYATMLFMGSLDGHGREKEDGA